MILVVAVLRDKDLCNLSLSHTPQDCRLQGQVGAQASMRLVFRVRACVRVRVCLCAVRWHPAVGQGGGRGRRLRQ